MNFLTNSHPKSSDAVRLVITDIIGHNICMASPDGQKVYEQIAAE